MMGWAGGSPSRSSEGCLLTISSWPMCVFPGKLVDLEGLRKMLSGQVSQFSGSREPAVILCVHQNTDPVRYHFASFYQGNEPTTDI